MVLLLWLFFPLPPRLLPYYGPLQLHSFVGVGEPLEVHVHPVVIPILSLHMLHLSYFNCFFFFLIFILYISFPNRFLCFYEKSLIVLLQSVQSAGLPKYTSYIWCCGSLTFEHDASDRKVVSFPGNKQVSVSGE